MKRTTLSSLVTAGALLLLPGCYFSSAAVTPAVGVTVTNFDPYLEPYGTWLDLPGYGRTWQPSPRYVGADFYPYGTGGQWLLTDSGWVFESDYPFGWAVFHYGRWFRHGTFGWLWVPGSEWAPSWVSWRVGGPYVGWAPLGPHGALSFSAYNWCFVPATSFTVRNVRAYSTGAYDFHRAVGVTSPVRRARVGPPPRYISRATGVNIRPVPVGDVRSAGRVPPPRPPPPSSRSTGPVQVRPPPPPTGWRSRPAPPPPSSRGFSQPAPNTRTPPPPPGGFSRPEPNLRSAPRPEPNLRSAPPPTPRSFEAPATPPRAVPAPAPMQAPTRVQPPAPRAAPLPGASAPAPLPSPAPAPSYRAPPPMQRSSPSVPAPPSRFSAPAPHRASPPAPAPRHAPPPPPRR